MVCLNIDLALNKNLRVLRVSVPSVFFPATPDKWHHPGEPSYTAPMAETKPDNPAPDAADVYSVDRLISETRRLAAEYRKATGKSLAVSAEIARHDACRLLGLEPVDGVGGHDALDPAFTPPRRVQIKGRAIFDESKPGQRIGQLKLDQEWDVVMLVLMDEAFETTEILEADREAVVEALQDSEGRPRSKRGAMSVARFRRIGRLVWTPQEGRIFDEITDYPA